ncbi:hypothetical protein AGR4A_Cc50002 [Agrobacterium tumefaciens str. B6]|uniref:Uncharacterized protein n=1 Tax=Agrobacterium tumefaciens str. B6 TaxID=1183423 RepID=A0A822V4E5_AGRTU|nr:hypothetical protein AGR4A_Cc50002 [Agrobacterium tumefaciens str. B6]
MRLRIGKRHASAIGEDGSWNHDQARGAGTGMGGIVTMRTATARFRFMGRILRVFLRAVVPIICMMRMGIVVFHRRL